MHNKAIIVLGCGIDTTGNLNPDATESVGFAIELLQNSPDTYLIMSGDVSYKADFKASISEAQAMKDYAITQGTNPTTVFVETESKDSLGNLLFTRMNLLEPLGISDVVIVRGPNQSDERIGYLATKILGPGYTFVVKGAEATRQDQGERERKSLAVAHEWLDLITDGDTAAVYALLREKHPGYNSSLDMSSLKNKI